MINPLPRRCEIWLVAGTPPLNGGACGDRPAAVNFDPTVGSEIRKTRPSVIVSSDAAGKLPIKLIAPITDWKDYFADNFWHVRLEPDNKNGLTKVSAVDSLQLRGMDIQRFIRKLGQISESQMIEITLAIATLIEY